MGNDRYALTYRAAEARQVMNWIKAEQSGCLVGLRGAGKSNFVHFMLRQDVQRHYLGRNWTDYAFVLVDFLALAECTEWIVYELVLDRLLTIRDDVAEQMAPLQREVMRSRDLLTAQRAVEHCIDALCQRPAQKIVLFFDEFDAVFQTLNPPLFRCLRAIRDAHKGRVSYVVVASDDLTHLRDNLAPVDHFYRLVSRNVCNLGPYNADDAHIMLQNLASRRSAALDAQEATRLIELSGGHAGLLKAVLSLLWGAYRESGLSKLIPALNDESEVQIECRKVWGGLSESEQTALCAVAGETQADGHTLRRLWRKGLLREGRSGLAIFSPLFADFVRRQLPPVTTGTVIRRSPRFVQIDARRIKGLTEMEFEMLHYLYERRGQVCTKDELIENVYRQQYDRMAGGVSDAALQTLISRLRDKIEPDREQPRYVVTVRGEGYKFVEPEEGQILLPSSLSERRSLETGTRA